MFWPFLLLIVFFIFLELRHRKTTYYRVTHIPYFRMRCNLGRYGEYLTYWNLRQHEKEGAKFLFNLYIPKGENSTTEIDVLMISPKGLFVYESKNYSGWIFGSEHQSKWYQTLPQGRKRCHKESFYNPIMQNRTHIQHLKVLLGEAIPMHSIITFSDRCTLKNIQVANSDIHVINRKDVMNVTTTISSNTNNALSDAQIQGIYDRLLPYTQVDSDVRDRHIAEIEKRIHIESSVPTQAAAPAHPSKEIPVKQRSCQRAQEVASLRCPRCGGKLVLRTAKKGSNAGNRFYGCSNFPKCRYIRSI